MFQDKRVEIKRVIESQLAELDIHGSGEFEPIAMPVDSVSSALRFSHTTSVRLAEAATTEDARAIARDPRAAGGTTSFDRRLRSAAAIVAAVALAAGVVVWRSVSERPSAPPKGTAVEEIMLRVQATPESTTFSIDDGPARRAPIALRVAKDGREHRVRFDADGHVSRTEVARFDADLALSVALLPVAAAVGAALERPRPLQRAATAPASARSLAVNQKGSAANQALPTAAAQSAEPPAPAVTGGSTGAWDMPVKARTKPKTELDNGDPWATK